MSRPAGFNQLQRDNHAPKAHHSPCKVPWRQNRNDRKISPGKRQPDDECRGNGNEDPDTLTQPARRKGRRRGMPVRPAFWF